VKQAIPRDAVLPHPPDEAESGLRSPAGHAEPVLAVGQGGQPAGEVQVAQAAARSIRGLSRR
jgi:hypothetical protein